MAVLFDDPALTKILLSHASGMDPAFVTKIRGFYDGVKLMLSESLTEGQRLGIVAAPLLQQDHSQIAIRLRHRRSERDCFAAI